MSELRDLGREVVTLPGWRWMPGAVVRPILADGSVEDVKGVVVETSPLPVVWWSDIRETRGHHPVDHLLPDLADPATLGCLLALVREAWAGDRVTVADDDGGNVWVIVRWGEIPMDVDIRAVERWVFFGPEAECLVGALAAAPGRVA